MILARVYLLPLTDLFYRFTAEFVYGVLKEIDRSVAKEHKLSLPVSRSTGLDEG